MIAPITRLERLFGFLVFALLGNHRKRARMPLWLFMLLWTITIVGILSPAWMPLMPDWFFDL